MGLQAGVSASPTLAVRGKRKVLAGPPPTLRTSLLEKSGTLLQILLLLVLLRIYSLLPGYCYFIVSSTSIVIQPVTKYIIHAS